jgi:hypothetical protein
LSAWRDVRRRIYNCDCSSVNRRQRGVNVPIGRCRELLICPLE